MVSVFRGSFSLRGSKTPPWYVVTLIVIAAFAVGVGAGWVTGYVPQLINALETSATPSPSPSAVAKPTVEPSIPAEQYPKIVRNMDADDATAGLDSLDIPLVASGTMVPVPGEDPPATTGDTRYVRIEVEDGLPIAGEAASDDVMKILNDPRGWGGVPSQTFARTNGVPEIRILFASPQTAKSLCARPHDPLTVPTGPSSQITLPDLAATLEPSPGTSAPKVTVPSPSATPSATPTVVPSCADRGLVVINAYYWAAGVAAFADDRPAARAWLVNHFVGHFLALPDVKCDAKAKHPEATVMVNQELDIAPCTPQAWPHPDGLTPTPNPGS